MTERRPYKASFIIGGAVAFVLAAAAAGTFALSADPPPAPQAQSSPPVDDDISTPEPTTAVTAQGRAASLASLDPCGLMAIPQATLLGYSTLERAAAGSVRSCIYSTSASAATLTISLARIGIGEMTPNPEDKTRTRTVGGHSTMLIEGADANRCTIVFDTGQGETATVQSQHPAAAADTCVQTIMVAEKIEPLLPLP